MSFAIRSRFFLASRELINCVKNNSNRWNSSLANRKSSKGYLKYITIGTGLGTIIGGGYALYTLKYNRPESEQVSITEAEIQTTSTKIKSLPDVKFARQIKVSTDKSGLDIILFQYPTCPFCCKVRAFLDYYGLSYNIVEVNPVLRQQIKWSKYKKVPILLIRTGEEYLQLNDSTMIVSCLATYLRNKNYDLSKIPEYYPTITGINSSNSSILNKYFVMHGGTSKELIEEDKEERKWRKWADDTLVHTLSPNVYRTKEEALQAFNWFSEVGEWDRLFPSWERALVIYVGAYAMYFIGKKLKKRHGLKDNVRESLYDECRTWINEVKKRGQFFGGPSPNLADLAVYGVLSSIEGCQAFQELLENTKIGTWYFEMKNAVQNHCGAKALN